MKAGKTEGQNWTHPNRAIFIFTLTHSVWNSSSWRSRLVFSSVHMVEWFSKISNLFQLAWCWIVSGEERTHKKSLFWGTSLDPCPNVSGLVQAVGLVPIQFPMPFFLHHEKVSTGENTPQQSLTLNSAEIQFILTVIKIYRMSPNKRRSVDKCLFLQFLKGSATVILNLKFYGQAGVTVPIMTQDFQQFQPKLCHVCFIGLPNAGEKIKKSDSMSMSVLQAKAAYSIGYLVGLLCPLSPKKKTRPEVRSKECWQKATLNYY